MKSRRKIACIILAAGASVRFGRAKQLFKIKGRPLIQYSIDAANNSCADYTILVLGSNSSEILSKAEVGRAQVVLNKNYTKGQSSSIRAGLQNLPEDTLGAIIMVADQPFIKSSHLDMMIREFRKGRDRAILLSHSGEPRNPVLIPEKLFPKLAKLKGDVGARSTVRNYENLRLVEIRDEKAFLDVDTMQSGTRVRKLA
jgi:CTP:molybdopterin cytidylyltransferase MocA